MTAKHLALATFVLMVVGMLAGPALAQEDAAGEPPGVAVDPAIDEYADVLPRVIERPPPTAVPAPPEVEVTPATQVAAETEVLGVTQERLAVTGSDLVGIAILGLLFVGVGLVATRRGRAVAGSD